MNFDILFCIYIAFKSAVWRAVLWSLHSHFWQEDEGACITTPGITCSAKSFCIISYWAGWFEIGLYCSWVENKEAGWHEHTVYFQKQIKERNYWRIHQLWNILIILNYFDVIKFLPHFSWGKIIKLFVKAICNNNNKRFFLDGYSCR